MKIYDHLRLIGVNLINGEKNIGRMNGTMEDLKNKL